MIKFLKEDPTCLYDSDECARLIQMNAENTGINAGIARMTFYLKTDDQKYITTCVVFNTTDKGIIFTDSTYVNDALGVSDSIFNVEKGKESFMTTYTTKKPNGMVSNTGLIIEDFEIYW